MKKHHNLAAVEDAAASENRIKSVVENLFASGAVEIEMDDTDLRKSIAAVQTESRTGREGLAKRIESDIAPTLAKTVSEVHSLVDYTTKSMDGLMKAVKSGMEEAKSSRSSVTFDEAKIKAIADEVYRGSFTTALAAELKAGTTALLPPILKVDPYFVENAQTERIERAIRQSRHMMASGPSGSGKTFPIEQVVRKHGKRYLKVSVSDGLSYSHFVSRANVRATAKGTETYYTDGFLPFSMKAGIPLILDEIDQCQPEIVSVLNAALESRTLYVPETGETVKAAKGWLVFMTCNTLRDSTGNYAGFRLSAALTNRVVFGKADYLTAPEEIAILCRVGLVEKDAKTITGMMNGLRAAYVAGKLTAAPSTRLAVRIARCLLGQDDDGAKCDTPMKLTEAWEYCFLDGLQDAEVNEALAVLKNGI